MFCHHIDSETKSHEWIKSRDLSYTAYYEEEEVSRISLKLYWFIAIVKRILGVWVIKKCDLKIKVPKRHLRDEIWD